LFGPDRTSLPATVADIILVSIVIYWVIMLAKRSRASWHIMWGLMILVVTVSVTDWMHLWTLNWLLQTLIPLGPMAIVILFYPELRHALEDIGRVAGWGRSLSRMTNEDAGSVIKEIAASAARMSGKRVGALMVLERDVPLDDIATSGTHLHAAISTELLCTIFHPGSALHDGAVIVRGNRLVAAGCILPLSDSVHIGTMIHTRHKAAIGMSEVSDAAVVVVSEETGTISLALEGKLHSGLNEETLTKWLKGIFGDGEEDQKSNFKKTVDDTLRRAGLRS
jgi:diadenylate cyclase